jgi:uncharacterized protein (DUF362 family)
MPAVTVDFHTYEKSVAEALDLIQAGKRLATESHVLIKPNLVNASPHPVTTPAACCEAVVNYVRSNSDSEMVIAEGTGSASRETYEIFDLLGYTELASRHGVSLIDLNEEPLQRLEDPGRPLFKEFYLPEIAFTHCIISVPVLKAHSLAAITGTLKNMMGFAPPKYYGGGSGGWKKAQFHNNMQQSIIDLNRYRSPDISLMDATVGLADFHLGGRHCSPPAEKIIAGFDPWDVDRMAAELLGLDWKTIPHLSGDTLRR